MQNGRSLGALLLIVGHFWRDSQENHFFSPNLNLICGLLRALSEADLVKSHTQGRKLKSNGGTRSDRKGRFFSTIIYSFGSKLGQNENEYDHSDSSIPCNSFDFRFFHHPSRDTVSLSSKGCF